MDRKEMVLLALKNLGINCYNTKVLNRQDIESKLPLDFCGPEVDGHLRALSNNGYITLSTIRQNYVVKMETAGAIVVARLEEELKRESEKKAKQTKETTLVQEVVSTTVPVTGITSTDRSKTQENDTNIPWKKVIGTCFLSSFFGGLIACAIGVVIYMFFLK